MKSLFDAAENASALERIQSLSKDSKPEWGKMGPAQMQAHCCVGFEVATGKTQLKPMFMGRLIGRFVKKSALNPKPFKHGLPTAPDFIVKDERDFDQEHARLTELVREFAAKGPAGLTSEPHPFFGKMSQEDWDLLMWKHLDHHLRQFGA